MKAAGDPRRVRRSAAARANAGERIHGAVRRLAGACWLEDGGSWRSPGRARPRFHAAGIKITLDRNAGGRCFADVGA